MWRTVIRLSRWTLFPALLLLVLAGSPAQGGPAQAAGLGTSAASVAQAAELGTHAAIPLETPTDPMAVGSATSDWWCPYGSYYWWWRCAGSGSYPYYGFWGGHGYYPYAYYSSWYPYSYYYPYAYYSSWYPYSYYYPYAYSGDWLY